ncbi:MAG TPA: M14-type cytosolic carboxypeptidase [Opitutus sp.]|nr:M14-type cytosolic carboxypeptidase [Opitutus sp.]
MRFPTMLGMLAFLALRVATAAAEAPERPPVHFNWAFESGSIGRIDKLGENEFRLHVVGQQDARGRNRQATWFYFRMEHVAGRTLTLHFTDFRGEYNDVPSTRSPVGRSYRPWFSEDNVHWNPVDQVDWNEAKDEATITLHPQHDTFWVAHVPPYTHARLRGLLDEVTRSPDARVEVIGKSVLGRDLHLVTITDLAKPDANKKLVWLMARQHPWETGTSYIMEGALRFLISDDPLAQKLRGETIFKLMPMMNPDGVVRGDCRFNVNGYDTNRGWDVVDLRDKQWLVQTPEIWYVKTRILFEHRRHPIAIMVNLHTDEGNEYFESMIDAQPEQGRLDRLYATLAAKTLFDPSRPKVSLVTTGPKNSTASLWPEARVPIVTMERRIVRSPKLGRVATPDDNLQLGRQLIATMAEVAHDDPAQ